MSLSCSLSLIFNSSPRIIRGFSYVFMCLHPVLIDNPNYHLQAVSQYLKNKDPAYVSKNHNLLLKDCTFRKIYVPCGRCAQCLALKQSYLVQRVQMESLDNDLFFGTLTYSNEHLRRVNVNGFDLAYADIKDVQNMFKRIRKYQKLPKFRYMVVSEYGGRRHRPHFHFLLSVAPESLRESLAAKVSRSLNFHDVILSEWKRNYGSTRKPIYKPLCNYICNSKGRNFDLHYVNPSLSSNGQSDVAFYVSKYITKSNKYVDALKSALYFNVPKESFKELWNLLKPRVLYSKGFGNPTSPKVYEHIRKSIEFGLNSTTYQYPIFLNPITSQTFPLAPYYRNKFMTLLDSFGFHYKQDSELSDGSIFMDDYDPADVFKKEERAEKTSLLTSLRDDYNMYLDDVEDDDFIDFVDEYKDIEIPKTFFKQFDYESYDVQSAGFESCKSAKRSVCEHVQESQHFSDVVSSLFDGSVW